MSRVRATGRHRPMAGNPKAMEELNSILESREALYRRAEATVDTSGRTLSECRAELVRTVRQLGIFYQLDPRARTLQRRLTPTKLRLRLAALGGGKPCDPEICASGADWTCNITPLSAI